MESVRDASPPGRYLVELTPLTDTLDDIQALVARARAATEELSRRGTSVRLLRSMFVPEDRSFFLLFEGDSAWAAEEAGRQAAPGAPRVSEAVSLAPRSHTTSETHGPGDEDRDGAPGHHRVRG